MVGNGGSMANGHDGRTCVHAHLAYILADSVHEVAGGVLFKK